MKNTTRMFFSVLLIGALIIAVILSFVSLGIAHPAPWILLIIAIAIPYWSNRQESRHFVVWKDEYSVGIPSIDDDHQKLLSLINQLQTAVHYQTGELFEKQALDAVVDYTKYHFQREENLMQENDYADFEQHKKEHEAMIAKVEELTETYKIQGHEALEDLAEYLKNWLINHINGTDQQYSEYLVGKGVS